MVPTVTAFDVALELRRPPSQAPAESRADAQVQALAEAPAEAAAESPVAAELRVVAQPARPARPTAATPPAGRSRAARAAVSCPYCAEPLKSPPVASGKCPRCRQQIVVRRVGDRAIYLTEAALPVFLTERRRAAHAGRWTRERDRWLELAMSSGAEPVSVTRLARQILSEEVVAGARSLYMSTVERSTRAARRARRWEEAARLRSDQALALYRIARSAKPVPAEILAVHRDGLASSLRGIAEIAKSAEMRAATCCDACRADDGRTVRIAEELRRASLPHEACPKGLCRCRWYLADRDRTIVTDLLRRQTRHTRQRPAAGA